MANINKCRQLALAFAGAVEEPHFQKMAFKINKKIFATLDAELQCVVINLSPDDQALFCAYDKTIIYPVRGSWGKKGWTVIELKKVKLPMLKEALKIAYYTTAPTLLTKPRKKVS